MSWEWDIKPQSRGAEQRDFLEAKTWHPVLRLEEVVRGRGQGEREREADGKRVKGEGVGCEQGWEARTFEICALGLDNVYSETSFTG